MTQPIRLYNLTNQTSYKLNIKTMSKKFSFNKEDGLKIAKGAGIAVSGALLTYLIEVLPNVNFGEYTLILAPILSILINAGLKFISGKK